MSSRTEELRHEFRERMNEDPFGMVEVPGRVNIIGEHIDYSGYAVLPMALEQNATLVFSVSSDPLLSLKNTNSVKYEDFSLDLSRPWNIELGSPHWYKYFLCGIRGIMDEFPQHNFESKGFKVLYDGQIPPSAGLSSSSAVVVAAALCMLKVHNLKLDSSRLADVCGRAEHYIGTQGGGMDQAIEILAEKGHAKLIEFRPLQTFNVSLPPGAHFVIVNSLAESNKAAGTDFNTRVIECKLASKLLAQGLGINPSGLDTLKQLQTVSKLSFEEMESNVVKILKSDPYSREELFLNESTRELIQNWTSTDQLHLQKRAKHVFAEAKRVYDFKNVAESQDQDNLNRMGLLMLQSHESCRDLYECSHPDLDRLVKLSTDHGAYGARLTGAGWGGCIIALFPANKISDFKKVVIESYYKEYKGLNVQSFDSYIFETQPGEGARSMVF